MSSQATLWSRLTQNNVLALLLGVVCIIIWGRVLYQIAVGLQRNEDMNEDMEAFVDSTLVVSPSDTSPVLPVRQDQFAPLDSSVRDPFRLPSALLPKPAPPPRDDDAPVRRPEPPPLPFSLGGIIDRTALLNESNGTVHLVQAGDRIGETTVLRIDAESVLLRVEGHRSRLRLSQ